MGTVITVSIFLRQSTSPIVLCSHTEVVSSPYHMHCDYLIIGQGLAGTLLSYELLQAGKNVRVVHDTRPLKASMAAGGLINPFSSRDWSRIKTQDLYLPDALRTYRHLETLLAVPVIRQTAMLIFHENKDQRRLFEEKKTALAAHMKSSDPAEQALWELQFNIPHGMGSTQPLYIIDAGALLRQWRHYLQRSGRFLDTVFDSAQLKIREDHIIWQDIRADHIVFCEGSAAQFNPLFPDLPFTGNRGEALLVSIPDLPLSHIYHHGIRLVPRSDGLFWCGSNYKWTFTDLEPDQEWRVATQQKLKQWLKHPFHIEDHLVAERPTTAGQRVITRRHAVYPHVSLFNGLGTRGFSSGPYYARLFAQTLGN